MQDSQSCSCNISPTLNTPDLHFLPTCYFAVTAWPAPSLRYNISSQVVLAHVTVVSHGMLEMFKRIFVLVAATALLGDVEWKWHNAAGAALATLGTVLYFGVMSAAGGGVQHIAAGKKAHGHPPLALSVNAPSQGSPLISSSSKRLGTQSGPTSASAAATARRVQWAYGLMILVLVLSPAEFIEGLGAPGGGLGGDAGGWWQVFSSGWTPAVTVMKESEAEIFRAANMNASEPWPSTEGNASIGRERRGPAPLASPAGDSQRDASDPPSLELFSLDVGPPNMTLLGLDFGIIAVRDDNGSIPHFKGGIKGHQGLLPYHRMLKRSEAGSSPFCLPPMKSATNVSAAGSLTSSSRSLRGTGGNQAPVSREGGQAMMRTRALRSLGDSSLPPRLASLSLRGIYTGWLGKENLGDDIVADIFLDLLVAAVIEATDGSTCVTLDRSSSELAEEAGAGGGVAAPAGSCSFSDSTGCDFGVMGGGSLGEL